MTWCRRCWPSELSWLCVRVVVRFVVSRGNGETDDWTGDAAAWISCGRIYLWNQGQREVGFGRCSWRMVHRQPLACSRRIASAVLPLWYLVGRVPSGSARAVIINSGNSNAATGDPGIADAERMTAELALAIGCRPEDVLVCSTGVIGVPLPMPLLLSGIPQAAGKLASDAQSLLDAATAMMTTDTVPKLTSLDLTLSGGGVRIAGVCKGQP